MRCAFVLYFDLDTVGRGHPTAPESWPLPCSDFLTRIFPLFVGDGVLDVPNGAKSSHAFADNFASFGHFFASPRRGEGTPPYCFSGSAPIIQYSVGNGLDRSGVCTANAIMGFATKPIHGTMQASSPTNVCRFAANIYVSPRRGRVPPPYRASCPSPTKPNTPVLIPAVTQPKQRRGYFFNARG